MPTVVGETSGGDPVFEVRSIRLVLRSDANHFNRVAACAKCGREMPGAAVLSPADLDLTPHPVICKECVSSAAGKPLFATEASPPLGPALAPPVANGANGSAAPAPGLPPPDDGRVAALERRLAELSVQLATRRATGAAPVEPATEPFGDRLSALERRLDEAIDILRAREVSQPQTRAEEIRGAVEPYAAGLRDDIVRLTEAVEDRRRASDEVSQRVDDIAERLTHDAESGRARVQDMEERLRHLPERLEQLAGSVSAQRAELEAMVERRVDEVQAAVDADLLPAREGLGQARDEFRRAVAGMAERLDELGARYDAGLAQTKSDCSTLAERLAGAEAQLTERVDGLADGIVSHRSDLLAIVDARVGDVQAAVNADLVPAREALDQARNDFRHGVVGLTERLDQLQARYDAGLAEAKSEWTTLAERLADAETQLTERVDRLADGILTHRSDLLAILDARVGEVQSAVDLGARQAFAEKEEAGRARDELRRELDGLTESVQRLQSGLDAELTRVASNLVRVDARLSDRLRALAEGVVSQRSELEVVLAALVEEAQTGLEAGAANMATQSAALGRAQDELARLGERLDRLAERADRAGPDSVAHVTQALEAQRADLEGQLDAGLAEVRATVDASMGAGADRLRALEEQAARAAAQLSEIDELLGVLDAGFGELRSGLQEVRNGADVRAELAAHEEALATLGRSVETLRRKVRSTTLAAAATPRKK